MTLEADITINAPASAVWEVITDIDRAAETIRGIERIEILAKPEAGLVDLKWRETRTMFGKTATEEMEIVEATENEFYKTEAASHGCVYRSTLSLSGHGDACRLTMSHQSEPQTLLSKLVAPLMDLCFKKAIRKVILEDLEDIKSAAEGRTSDPSAAG